MPRKTPGPPCTVCQQPSVAKGMCDKHYRRWSHYGDTQATLRPKDWGQRSSHPLHDTWLWTNRSRHGRAPQWNDFWSFVSDVGEKPSAAHRLLRLRKKEPWGPDNFIWKESLTGGNYTASNRDTRARYQRDWRAANRLRSKSNDLKKSYGITLDQYDEMLEAQGGVCAICKSTDPAFAHLAVDHCHGTGKIRGLLCCRCNRALGGFNDDLAILKRALLYLGG